MASPSSLTADAVLDDTIEIIADAVRSSFKAPSGQADNTLATAVAGDAAERAATAAQAALALVLLGLIPTTPAADDAISSTVPPPPLLAVATEGPDRGEGNGLVAGIEVPAAIEVVLVRRASAVRRYPPGCGRAAAASKPSKAQSASRNGEAESIAGDQKVEVNAGSNGWMNGGGDAGGAREEFGGRPWDLTGLMLPPFLPWAQHGRRSQRQKFL
uniref:Uncharacterized protein n=1 Tax=Oryza glumipatula TaxID=40148 RepID=A0A0D9YV67_9ORYZ